MMPIWEVYRSLFHRSHFVHPRYTVSDFLAAILAKAALMVLEALLMRLLQALVTSSFRVMAPQAA
ncbi:hypothetical protein MPTA5024_03695 [Microbispora sp. ATCC PTA-5024]|nr:hypothetical protein MPTA5024_03695 [Microbispora sp. ATCC PTA-5024]